MSVKEKILVMGGTGFIGSELCQSLVENNWHINVLTRSISTKKMKLSFPCHLYEWELWNIPQAALEGVKVIINLVGEPIADHYWTPSFQKLLYESRINSVKALGHALEKYKMKPNLIIQASATGFYSDSFLEEHTEEGKRGSGFLSDLCSDWEHEAFKLKKYSRFCLLRLGIVLGGYGGAFPKLCDIYSLGLGGQLGSGHQWMNWVHIKDVVRFIEYLILNKALSGVYNLVAPNNANHKEFHSELCDYKPSLKRLIVPAFCLKVLLGARSSLVLKGSKVIPKRVLESHFKFIFPELKVALTGLFTGDLYPKAHSIKYKIWTPLAQQEVWNFMSSAYNLEKLTPPWMDFKVTHMSTNEIEKNTVISYKFVLKKIPLVWTTRIISWEPNCSFTDNQDKGPYKLWSHNHLFSELAGGTLIEDHIDYSLPFFPIGNLFFPLVKREIKRIFEYRQQQISGLFS